MIISLLCSLYISIVCFVIATKASCFGGNFASFLHKIVEIDFMIYSLCFCEGNRCLWKLETYPSKHGGRRTQHSSKTTSHWSRFTGRVIKRRSNASSGTTTNKNISRTVGNVTFIREWIPGESTMRTWPNHGPTTERSQYYSNTKDVIGDHHIPKHMVFT